MSPGAEMAAYFVDRLKEANIEYKGNINSDAAAFGLMLKVMDEHEVRQLVEFYFDHYEVTTNASWFAYNYDSIQEARTLRNEESQEVERLRRLTAEAMKGKV